MFHFSTVAYRRQLRDQWRHISTAQRIQICFGIVLWVVGILWGSLLRIISVFQYTDFRTDQAEHAQRLFELMHGTFPSLGPVSSVGNYFLTPLYYYMMIPVGVLGSHPIWPAFLNALLSTAAVILFSIFLWLLFKNNAYSKKILAVGLGTLWYAMIMPDIVLANRGWNPSSIPFFVFLTAVLWLLLEHYPNNKRVQLFAWPVLGVTSGLWTGLHSITLFIMPIVYLLMLWKLQHAKKLQWKFALAAIGIAFISLTPYWKGEIDRGWTNTKALVAVVSRNDATNADTHTFLESLNRSIVSYIQLPESTYFVLIAKQIPDLGIAWLWLVTITGIIWFRGQKTLFFYIGSIWLLYFCIASQYWYIYWNHYRVLIFTAPIIFSLSALLYAPKNIFGKIMTIFILLGIGSSLYSMSTQNIRYLDMKFGKTHAMSVGDTIEAFHYIPKGSTVCSIYYNKQALEYIDRHQTQKDFTFVMNELCKSSTVYTIYEHCRLDEALTEPVQCINPTIAPEETVVHKTESYTLVVHD